MIKDELSLVPERVEKPTSDPKASIRDRNHSRVCKRKTRLPARFFVSFNLNGPRGRSN